MKFFRITIITGGLLLLAARASAQVLISQVQTSGQTATDEYVVLYNLTSSTVPLENWALKKQTAGGTLYPLVSNFPIEAKISPFSYFLIAHQNYEPKNNITPDITYTNNSNSLADNNAALLFSDSGSLVDTIFWGAISSTNGAPAPNQNASEALTRQNDATGNVLNTGNSSADFALVPSDPKNSASPPWPETNANQKTLASTTTLLDTPSSTPEETNAQTNNASTSTATASTTTLTEEIENADTTSAAEWFKLKINEIHPAPEDDNEWIELYNAGGAALALKNIFICDSTSATSSCKTSSSTINPGEFLKIDLGTTRYLNNEGDSVKIISPDFGTLDEVAYAKSLAPEKNQSLARVSDGQDTDAPSDWSITILGTPGAPNVISRPPVASANTVASGDRAYVPTPDTTPSKKTTTTTSSAATDLVRLALKISLPPFAAPSELINFSAFGSADPRGGRLSYHWNFGDGILASGQTVNHTFTASGTYIINLNATSSGGTIGSITKKIIISPDFFVASGTIIISEALANPRGDETDEFIELENTSNATTSIALWQLKVNKKIFIIPEHTQILPHDFVVFYRSITKIALANTSDQTITLSNQANTLVDTVHITSSKTEGASFARFGGEWQNTANPTPGELNLLAQEFVESEDEEAPTTQKPKNTKPAIAKKTASKNTLTTITGTVSTPPGIFGKRLLHIATKTGGWLLELPAKWSAPAHLGDEVSLTGLLIEPASQKKYIQVKTLIKKGAGGPPTSTLLTTDQISEEAHGALVTMAGEITERKASSLILDDGMSEQMVVFKSGAHITKTNLSVGKNAAITGVLINNNGRFELWPRGDKDVLLTNPKSAVDAPKAPGAAQPVTYGVTTLGGAGLLAAVQWLKKSGRLAALITKKTSL